MLRRDGPVEAMASGRPHVLRGPPVRLGPAGEGGDARAEVVARVLLTVNVLAASVGLTQTTESPTAVSSVAAIINKVGATNLLPAGPLAFCTIISVVPPSFGRGPTPGNYGSRAESGPAPSRNDPASRNK